MSRETITLETVLICDRCGLRDQHVEMKDGKQTPDTWDHVKGWGSVQISQLGICRFVDLCPQCFEFIKKELGDK